MRVSFPDYKYCGALKRANIDTLYDRRGILNTNENKLAKV